MRKIFIGGFTILAITAAVAFNVNISSQKNNMSSLSLANAEALAQESGTSVGYCYLVQSFVEYGWKLFCNSGTNDNTIFPCPSSTSYAGFSESAKDRCTK